MKEILLLRHAKSARPAGTDDFDRPLAERGRRDAPETGRLIVLRNRVPDLIISSPAVRALETARLAAEAMEYRCEIACSETLYPGSVQEILRILPGIDENINRVTNVQL